MTRIDFSQSNSISIFLPANPSFDATASALSLKLSLETMGKTTSLVCATPMTVEVNRLVGVDSISHSFGGRNLVISFPGQTEMVDKVSYNVDNGELQLVITPKAEAPAFDPSRLKFVSGGIKADLVVMVGIRDLTQLGSIYEEIKDQLVNLKLIYFNEDFDYTAVCLSEIMANLLKSQAMPVTSDVATNLMQGLSRGSKSFSSPKLSKLTFELAAWLMGQGARPQEELSAGDFPNGSIPGQLPIDQPDQPDPDWYEPKIYRGTTVS